MSREQARRQHRADLADARLAVVRRSRRSFRAALALLIAGPAAGFAIVPLVAGGQSPVLGEGAFSTLIAREAQFEELTVRGSLRVVDEQGRALALLHREGEGDGPMVLSMFSARGDRLRQTLRMATSETGAALTLVTPDEDSEVALVAAAYGPEVKTRRAGRTRVLSEQSRSAALPAVSATTGRPLPPLDFEAALPAAQEIGHGFLVTRLRVAEQSDGLMVSGRVINATSLRHSGIAFQISGGGASHPFHIPLISPGNSTGFVVTLPGVSKAGLDPGRIDYVSSTVTYAAHWAKDHQGELSAGR